MRRRVRYGMASVTVAALAALALFVPQMRLSAPAAAASGSHDVIANLFMWPWPSVASECTNVLAPAGYGAVQVSPPEDSISVAAHPWWDIYQPVGYDLNSRMGNRAQFVAMVSACHAAGVKVYVDAVINHTIGTDQTSTTSYGGDTFGQLSFPEPGYTAADFHSYPTNCPNSDDQIHNWNSQTEVQECQLLSLSDLNTESDHVRSTIAGYLNDLISIGVDGFRVDAAKHINQNDLAAIEAKLTAAPFVFQEVMPGGSGNLAPSAFEGNGSLLEFNYGYALKNAFNGSIASLSNLGPASGLLPSDKSVVFVENHDTERDGSTLNYKAGATDTLANVFMLAWNFGTPTVMSSFTFANNDDSPPADGNGYVSPASCGNGWQCQHRTRAIKNMVGFHNATRGDSVANWWSDGANAVSFSRGSDGFIALNNGSSTVSRTFTTGLADGTYCDVIHGDFAGGSCSGPTVTVSGGAATISVAAKDAVAIDVAERVTTAAVAVTFHETATTWYGQNVFVVGSIPQLGSWNTANAIPLSAATYPVWAATVNLPPSTAVQYKYIKKDPDGTVTWESDPNRAYTTPAGGSVTLTDSWR